MNLLQCKDIELIEIYEINLYDFIMLELPLEDPETTLTEIVLKNINLTIKKGDLVLVLGKGHEKTILRADGPHDFEDIKVVKKILKAKK